MMPQQPRENRTRPASVRHRMNIFPTRIRAAGIAVLIVISAVVAACGQGGGGPYGGGSTPAPSVAPASAAPSGSFDRGNY